MMAGRGLLHEEAHNSVVDSPSLVIGHIWLVQKETNGE